MRVNKAWGCWSGLLLNWVQSHWTNHDGVEVKAPSASNSNCRPPGSGPGILDALTFSDTWEEVLQEMEDALVVALSGYEDEGKEMLCVFRRT
jgi:hypothetical protein